MKWSGVHKHVVYFKYYNAMDKKFVHVLTFECFSVRYDKDASKYWDRFYEMHQNKFFKNRQWLFSEFPEILPQSCGTKRTAEGQEASVPAFPELSMESQQGGAHIPNHAVLREKQKHTDYLSAMHSQEAAAFPGHHASFRILEVIDFLYRPILIVIYDRHLDDMLRFCYRWAVV